MNDDEIRNFLKKFIKKFRREYIYFFEVSKKISGERVFCIPMDDYYIAVGDLVDILSATKNSKRVGRGKFFVRGE